MMSEYLTVETRGGALIAKLCSDPKCNHYHEWQRVDSWFNARDIVDALNAKTARPDTGEPTE
jgi:hypothetical protein